MSSDSQAVKIRTSSVNDNSLWVVEGRVRIPTRAPIPSPSYKPTYHPSHYPTHYPSHKPTHHPSHKPTHFPTKSPTSVPTFTPSAAPTAIPTSIPTSEPTALPTSIPTSEPTALPTSIPTSEPTALPTSIPTSEPTAVPTSIPTSEPTATPTSTPTFVPTAAPTSTPTSEPTATPTSTPTSVPTWTPTSAPTPMPTQNPTASPTSTPTARPTSLPTKQPTSLPSTLPTSLPTPQPTAPHTGYTGQSSPGSLSILHPYLGFNFVIALTGVFPPRSRRLGEFNSTNVQKYSHRRLGYDTFVGEIFAFSGNYAPYGYALCQGQLMAISQNTALFSLLGTYYGGNGVSNFALPDLRGRVTVSAGQGAGLSLYNLGETTGVETQSLRVSNLPSHTHTLPAGGNTQSTGSNTPIAVIQPTLTINYIISLYGVYPSQSRRLHESTRHGTDSNTARFYAQGNDPFVGEIALFAGNFAPANWALCNGQILSIADYDTLFNLIGKRSICITYLCVYVYVMCFYLGAHAWCSHVYGT